MGNGVSDMTDVVLETIGSGVRGLFGTFMKKPDKTNETMRAIQVRIEQERQQHQAQDEERFREREASARQREQETLDAARQTLEDARQARDEAARSVAKQFEESARQREEAALMEAKQIEAVARMREEATLMEAKQIEAAARMREEAALMEAKQIEAAARMREEAALMEAKQIEAAARTREEAATAAANERVEAAQLAVQQIEAATRAREEAALAEAAKAKDALQKGIRPVVMPTPEQVAAARERMQLNTEKLHFAVCGSSGSGKSTIINAIRGLGRKDKGTARVGVTECTSKIGRYPDPRNDLPYSRFIWYDIPGAGTTAVPDWQYFNDQGLFVFDFIIMVYDIRFTKIDVGIIENCLRFNIPVFIVRSKADQHIHNMMIEAEHGYIPGETEYDQIYQEMVDSYVSTTRLDFKKHMEDMADKNDIDLRDQELIYNMRVYIVSGATLRGLLQMKSSVKKMVIHETELIEDMLRTAARRRYSNTPGETKKNLFRKGTEALSAGLSSFIFNIGSEKTKKISDPKVARVMVDPKANGNEDPKANGNEDPKANGSEEAKANGSGEPKANGNEEPKANESEEPKANGSEEPKANGSEEPKPNEIEEPKANGIEEPKANGNEEPNSSGNELKTVLPTS